MAGIEAINAIKKKLIPENPVSIKNQQNNAAFLAYTNISPDDFSKNGQVPNWNAGNVPMTGLT